MINNYLKIAWRNLLKHKSFSLINIFGLAIGIAACMIIFIYVRHELTFDQFNKNAGRIARITATVHAPESDIAMAPTPALLAPTLKKEYPEVVAAVRHPPDKGNRHPESVRRLIIEPVTFAFKGFCKTGIYCADYRIAGGRHINA